MHHSKIGIVAVAWAFAVDDIASGRNVVIPVVELRLFLKG
jgi:hypothetical protein